MKKEDYCKGCGKNLTRLAVMSIPVILSYTEYFNDGKYCSDCDKRKQKEVDLRIKKKSR